jgi:hypothetical protein
MRVPWSSCATMQFDAGLHRWDGVTPSDSAEAMCWRVYAENFGFWGQGAPEDVCRGSRTSRADRLSDHLRAAQAYMLISMPTGTSTIFGVFQVIRGSSQLHWSNVGACLRRNQAYGCLELNARASLPHWVRTGNLHDRCDLWSRMPIYFSNRNRARPAFEFNSLASSVPSASEFAALKRCSTTARYSSSVSVPS